MLAARRCFDGVLNCCLYAPFLCTVGFRLTTCITTDAIKRRTRSSQLANLPMILVPLLCLTAVCISLIFLRVRKHSISLVHQHRPYSHRSEPNRTSSYVIPLTPSYIKSRYSQAPIPAPFARLVHPQLRCHQHYGRRITSSLQISTLASVADRESPGPRQAFDWIRRS